MKTLSFLLSVCLILSIAPDVLSAGMSLGSVEVENSSTAPLYKAPNVKSDITLNLFNGFTFGIYDELDDWVYIIFRSSEYFDTKLSDISGYMRRDDVNMDQVKYLDVKQETPIATVSAFDKSGEIKVYDVADEKAEVIATYLDGTILGIYGEIDNWFYIELGNVNGFIMKKDTLLNDMYGNYFNFPTIGKIKFDQSLWTYFLHSYPSLSSPTEGSDSPKTMKNPYVECIAVLDGWYEIRYPNGFVCFIMQMYIE